MWSNSRADRNGHSGAVPWVSVRALIIWQSAMAGTVAVGWTLMLFGVIPIAHLAGALIVLFAAAMTLRRRLLRTGHREALIEVASRRESWSKQHSWWLASTAGVFASQAGRPYGHAGAVWAQIGVFVVCTLAVRDTILRH